jgi:hypothetical protein
VGVHLDAAAGLAATDTEVVLFGPHSLGNHTRFVIRVIGWPVSVASPASTARASTGVTTVVAA